MTSAQKQIIKAIDIAKNSLSDLEELVEENSLSFADECKIGESLECAISRIESAKALLARQEEER